MKDLANIKTAWDLSILNINEGDLQKYMDEMDSLVDDFCSKWKNRSDYLESPEVLKTALDEYETLNASDLSFGRLSYYYFLLESLDESDTRIKAISNKLHEFSLKISDKIRFFSMRISKIPEEMQSTFVNSSALTNYKHYLEQMFKEAKYLLTEDQEKVVDALEKTASSNWSEMLSKLISAEQCTITDENNKEIIANMSLLFSKISSMDKRVRDDAAKKINEILKKYEDVAESEINSILEFELRNKELRKVSTVDELRLIGDDVDEQFVNALIESVSSYNHISKDFYKLKAKALGQEKLEYHERNVQLGKDSREITIEEGVSTVGEVFEGLDTGFFDHFRNYLTQGRIDFYPKKGKSSGAFCVQPSKNFPCFVFMNFNGKIVDLTTLAHEMGHAIHNELMSKQQNSLNFGCSLAIAEVASTFVEDFVLDKIYEDADDEVKFNSYMARLNDDVSSIFRQIACYKFERELHTQFKEKGYLSKREIGELFKEKMSEYMGDYVIPSEGSENWWIYWSHIRDPFYVYSYASGLLISKALQNMVREDKANIEKFKDILSKGSSDSPENIFRSVGIDIKSKDFWERGLKEIEKTLTSAENLC